jgi:diguanylate cyclase (GGDEF)-like protein
VGASDIAARPALAAEMPGSASSDRRASCLPVSLKAWWPPRLLVTGAGCDLLLRRRRVEMIAARLRAAVVVLAFAVVGWIAIDYFLFQADWAVLLPLAIARLVLGTLLLALARLELRRLRSALAATGLVLALMLGFWAFAHAVVADVAPRAIAGHAQYALLPVVLVAGLAILPLTLLEVTGLSLLPLSALALEIVCRDAELASHAGAALLLMLAVTVVTVVCALSQLRLLADMHAHTLRDPLTGALSRRAGIELMNMLLANSRRTEQPCSLALIDIDFLKSVNDDCGHEVGDRLLQDAARTLSENLRADDALVRWSGEEFVLVLPETSAPEAMKLVAGWCRTGLCRRPDGGVQTVSIGLAEHYADAAQDLPSLIGIADERMYAAKALGRDRINAPYGMSECIVGSGPTSAKVTSIARYLDPCDDPERLARRAGGGQAVLPA